MAAATTSSSPTPPPTTTKTQYTTTPQLPQTTSERSGSNASPDQLRTTTTSRPLQPPRHPLSAYRDKYHHLRARPINTTPNVDSDDNSPYPVPSRIPSPPSPAYCRTSPIEPHHRQRTSSSLRQRDTRNHIPPDRRLLRLLGARIRLRAILGFIRLVLLQPVCRPNSVPTWHGTSPCQPATMDT